MRRRRMGLALLACVIGLLLPVASRAQSEPASGSEWWYVLRGRANMKIGNFQAAIEAFEKAARLNPENREAMKQLGVAYERQGLTTRAIEQYDRYLERFRDDPEVAFKQAEYLGWSRYDYRRTDAIRYYRMGLAQKDDPARRHQLARLLAKERSQLDEALEQYRILLAAQPGNATWRSEFRDLLLWDDKHLDEAIREYRTLAGEKPGDLATEHELARLLARQSPRGDEAASRYRDLIAKRPRDAALRLEYAQLLSAHPRRHGQAIEQYRILLAQDGGAATREALADLLAGSENTRREALSHYELLLRERPRDSGVRLKYARLLGSRQDDTPAAVRQYSLVVAQDSGNAEAHAGLARSYAWLGDRDRALHHSNLAVRYGGRGSEVHAVRDDLLRGREPRLAPLVRALVQQGNPRADFSGVVLGLEGQADVTPFLTLRMETGFEDYWRGDSNAAAGFFHVGGELRQGPRQQFELDFGYHTLPESSRNVVVDASYTHRFEKWAVEAGFERDLRFDSYLALVGDRIAGVAVGAARENRFYAVASTRRGAFGARFEPSLGWVDARGVSANPFVGLRARLDHRLLERDHIELSPFYSAEIQHYDEDAFGFDLSGSEPLPGGYFSPRVFFEQVPGLSLDLRWGGIHHLALEGGPALQLVKQSVAGTRFEVGGHARLSHVTFLKDSLYWTLELDFSRIGEAYTRVGLGTKLTFKF